jgi:hypothetical protein
MNLPKDRGDWTPKHATRALQARDRAWKRYEEYRGTSQDEATELFGLYQNAEALAADVCTVTNVTHEPIV